MEEIRKVEFWDQEDGDILTHTEQDEAIEYILDGLIVDVNDLPETLEICGYARKEMSDKSLNWDVEYVVESLIERWDEEYGGDDYTKITDDMKSVAENFINEMKELYIVWQCEIVKKETINVKEWIKENRPNWLENSPTRS